MDDKGKKEIVPVFLDYKELLALRSNLLSDIDILFEKIERQKQKADLQFKKKLYRIQNMLICLLQIETGRRIGEILNLKKDQIQNNTIVFYLEKKGKKEEMAIPISKQTMKRLEKFINTAYIFKEFRGDKVFKTTRQAYNKWLKKYGKKLAKLTGNPKFAHLKSHDFRRSVATVLLSEKGLGIARVQVFLGHKKPETTEEYIKIKPFDKNPLFPE